MDGNNNNISTGKFTSTHRNQMINFKAENEIYNRNTIMVSERFMANYEFVA